MITIESAINDDRWHLNGCTRHVGPRGGVRITIREVRRNGRTRLWRRSPERFSVPVKYGMYEAFRIDEGDAERWHRPSDCPIREG